MACFQVTIFSHKQPDLCPAGGRARRAQICSGEVEPKSGRLRAAVLPRKPRPAIAESGLSPHPGWGVRRGSGLDW